MAYLTENQLSNVMDMPIAVSSTDLRMGDWVVLGTIKITTPMRLIYKVSNLYISASTVDVASITNGNKIFGNLGLAYLTMRQDYISGSPGAAGGLDVLVATGLGPFSRDVTNIITVATPGVYSWIVANNMQPSTDTVPIVPVSTSIDFRVIVTGTVRLEMDSA